MSVLKKEKVLIQLNQIFKNVFENENIEINDKSNSKNILEWDSLNHIYLVNEIESQFNIELTAEQILSWENVGEMADYLSKNV